MLRVATVLVVALALSTNALAEPTVADAEEVVRLGFEATKASDWQAYAKILHPDDQKSLATAFTTMAEMDSSGEVRAMFFDGLEVAGIKKLSHEEATVRVMKGIEAAVPMFSEILRSMELTVLGTVPEGDKFHVVTRVGMNLVGTPYEQMDVVTVKPFGGELRTSLSGDIEELVQGILQSME